MKIRWVNLDNFQQKKIFFVWELQQAMYMATEMTLQGKKEVNTNCTAFHARVLHLWPTRWDYKILHRSWGLE